MFEIREDKKFKGWFRIWIKTPSGNWLRSKRFSSLESAKKQLNAITKDR